MLGRTLVRPPYGSKAVLLSQAVSNVCLLFASFCARMAAINAASPAKRCRRLASHGAMPTGWHSQGGFDGRTGHDGEAAADPRRDPPVHVRARIPALRAGG